MLRPECLNDVANEDTEALSDFKWLKKAVEFQGITAKECHVR
jgi:hypothetical protein